MFELIPKTHFFTVTWKIMGVKRGLYSDCPRKHHPLAWYCLTSHFKKQKIKYGFVNSYWFVVIYMIVWDVCKHCPPLALHSLQSFLVWNTLSTWHIVLTVPLCLQPVRCSMCFLLFDIHGGRPAFFYWTSLLAVRTFSEADYFFTNCEMLVTDVVLHILSFSITFHFFSI